MKSVSRRRFLKGTAITGAAMGFPTIVPAQVVAGKGGKRVMPNDRVNVGQIGCGGIATYYHANHLKPMDNVRVVATCDAFKSRRETLAAKYATPCYEDRGQVVSDFFTVTSLSRKFGLC